MALEALVLNVRIPSTTGFTEDVVENVFTCAIDSSEPLATVEGATLAVSRFYTTDYTGPQTRAMGAYISSGYVRTTNGCSVNAYRTADLTGATSLGAPISIRNFTMPAAASVTNYPEEVATVLSFHGNLDGVPVSTGGSRPAQRRRGRIYFGPLNNQSGAQASGRVRPATSFRDDMAIAATNLAAELETNLTIWAVWSRADAALWPVYGGYIDDAWDTQRRRGASPTTRSVFTT